MPAAPTDIMYDRLNYTIFGLEWMHLLSNQDRWWLAPRQETEDCIAAKPTRGAWSAPVLGVPGERYTFHLLRTDPSHKSVKEGPSCIAWKTNQIPRSASPTYPYYWASLFVMFPSKHNQESFTNLAKNIIESEATLAISAELAYVHVIGRHCDIRDDLCCIYRFHFAQTSCIFE